MQLDCYFSSSHNISEIINKQIFDAKKSILLAMYTLTDRALINGLKEKRQSGIDILAIFDEAQLAKFNEIILELNNADIKFKTIGKKYARMHHKFLVIDDISVITGSFNWTNQASKSNMENIIIVENHIIAKKYRNEFESIWQLIASKGIGEYLTDKSQDKKKKKKDDVDIFIDELKKNRTNYNLVELRSEVVGKLFQLKEKNEYKEGMKIFDFLKEQKLDLKGNYLPDLKREFSKRK